MTPGLAGQLAVVLAIGICIGRMWELRRRDARVRRSARSWMQAEAEQPWLDVAVSEIESL